MYAGSMGRDSIPILKLISAIELLQEQIGMHRRNQMRVNVYAEEMTDRIEIISKEIDGHTFTGLRFYLYLPTTLPDGTHAQGPFMHRDGDDDSAAVTFWGKRDLRRVLHQALEMLNEHYDTPPRAEKEAT
jgi:hypothetical protein